MNTNTKHTPGPWLVTVDKDHCLTVSQPGSDGQVIANFRHAFGDAELEANVQLISAAPDLLNSLIEARRLLAGEMDWPVDLCTGGPFIQINAAIAKATGERA